MNQKNTTKEKANNDKEQVVIVEKPGLAKRALDSYTHVFRKTVTHVPGSIKNTKSIFSGVFSRAKKTSQLWEANKSDPDLALLEQDFQNVMTKWGLKENEVEGVARYYRSHFLSGLIGLILLLILLIMNLVTNSPLINSISIFVFMFASGFLSIASYWRYKVLSTRHFQPFLKWLNS